MNLKTTISSTKDIYDLNSQWLPKGNYYFTIREITNYIIKGDLIDRSLKTSYSFNYVTFIRMMSNAQARLARRANISSPNMPDILSPVTSPHRSTPNLLRCGNRSSLSTNRNSYDSLPNIASTNTIISSSPNLNRLNQTIEKCAICLENIDSTRTTTTTKLQCNHVFHKTCIDRWLLRKNTCPVCRARINNRNRRSSRQPRINTRSPYYTNRYNTRNNQRNNGLSNLPSIEQRYNARRNRYYRNI